MCFNGPELPFVSSDWINDRQLFIGIVQKCTLFIYYLVCSGTLIRPFSPCVILLQIDCSERDKKIHFTFKLKFACYNLKCKVQFYFRRLLSALLYDYFSLYLKFFSIQSFFSLHRFLYLIFSLFNVISINRFLH